MGTNAPTPERTPEAVDATTPGPEEKTTTTVATSGKREAFKAIARQLSQTDLSNPGVQKMLLEDLDRAEAQLEILEGFRDRFHEANTRAAVLREKLQTETALELLATSCFCLGGAAIGSNKGGLILVLGIGLILGAVAAKIVRAMRTAKNL
jgi:hypothetical protein